jgi:PAS domain S-box-containing protein
MKQEPGGEAMTRQQSKIHSRQENPLDVSALQNRIIAYRWDIKTGVMRTREPLQEAGTSHENVFDRSFMDSLIHPDDRSRVLKEIKNHLRDSDDFETEFRILTAPDKYMWVRDHARVVKMDRGPGRKVTGLLINISHLRELSEALKDENATIREELRQSKEEKNAILKGLEGLAHVRYLDPELRIHWDNSGLTPERISGKNLSTLEHCYTVTHGTTKRCADCPALDALVSGTRQERENTLEDGQSYMRRCHPVRDSQGDVSGIIHIALNVTKHKKTEEGLRTINAFLHSLLANSPTPICVTDRAGKIETVNEAWEKVLGIPEKRTAGQFLRDIFEKDVAERLTIANSRVLSSGFSLEMEELIDGPGGTHHFHIVKFPLQDGAGHTNAVGSIFVDVTERKRAEEELTKREAELRMKSVQLGEMNTALRVLLRQRETDQQEIEQRIVFNVKELVLPYVSKLKHMHPSDGQLSYLEIVEAHLNDIITPFLRQVVSTYPHMTTKELQVATLVREGKSNKEIADFMNVSVNTIEIHRYHIRKKLGVQNKKVNLRSFLLSLTNFPQ